MVTPKEALPIAVFRSTDGWTPPTGVRMARGVPGLLLAWRDPWRGRAAVVARLVLILARALQVNPWLSIERVRLDDSLKLGQELAEVLRQEADHSTVFE